METGAPRLDLNKDSPVTEVADTVFWFVRLIPGVTPGVVLSTALGGIMLKTELESEDGCWIRNGLDVAVWDAGTGNFRPPYSKYRQDQIM